MGWKNMDVSPAGGRDRKFAYEKSISLASVTTSDWIIIPSDVSGIAYTLSVAGGGKGKVEISTDPIDTVKTGSPVAVEWPSGEVAINTSDSSVAVTAVRLNQTFAGTTKLTVRAQ